MQDMDSGTAILPLSNPLHPDQWILPVCGILGDGQKVGHQPTPDQSDRDFGVYNRQLVISEVDEQLGHG